MEGGPAIGRRRRAVSPMVVPALITLAVAAAFAPPRLKLIGLFPAAVGAAAGFLVVRFLSRPDGPSRRTVLAIAAVLVPLTLAGYAVGSFCVWRHAKAEEVAANLLAQPGGRQVLERVRSDKPAANEVEADFLNAYRVRMNPRPAAYLTERLKGVSAKPSVAFEATVAGVEFLVGWVAGVGTAVFLSRRENVVAGVEESIG